MTLEQRISTAEWIQSTKAHRVLTADVKGQIGHYASELSEELKEELAIAILITVRAFEEQSKE